MSVHARSVPSGDIHLTTHLAHHLAVALSQLLTPCTGDHRLCRESDGALARKVVVDGHRTVRIDRLDFSYRVHGRSLISGQGNHVRHIFHCQLVEEQFPPLVVVIRAPQFIEPDAVVRACSRHLIVFIDICLIVKVAVQVILSHKVVGQHVRRRGCCRFVIVCEPVRP